jgi:hypothetical protein
MFALLAPALVVLAAPPVLVESRFLQVAPLPPKAGQPAPARHARAVVLIQGLTVSPVSTDRALRAELRTWQVPTSALVRCLAKEGDVFAFAYAQTVAVENIARATDLAGHVRGLRRLGYREIVLVGHSAGGLIVRHLVEDVPDLGVTKVIQVCAPNTGSSWAKLPAARPRQVAFLTSLTRAARQRALKERVNMRIPADTQFAVIVGKTRLGGDGIVSTRSQWPEDLQKQGVPAHVLSANHRSALRGPQGIALLARVVREPQPRWPPAMVAVVRRQLFD